MEAKKSRDLVTGMLLLALIVIGWRVWTMGMAEIHARRDPAQALSWRADHPVALLLQAERLAAAAGDQVRARQLAEAALQANPLEGRGYRVLARLAEADGDVSKAVQLHDLAVKRSPRDLPSRAWLFEHHLRAGRFTPALAHADAMLTVQPELAARLTPMLVALAQEPLAQPALAKVLRAAPPWREKFLGELCRQVPQGRRIAGLMAAVPALSRSELSAWLERLIADRAWDEAYPAWASRLPGAGPALSNIFNGGFEAEPSGQGFDWRFDHVPGASIELLADSRVSGRQALSVGFDSQRVPFQHVRQLLVLSPGRYRFEGHERGDGLRTPRGLVWTIACAEDARVLAATEPLKDDVGWRKFEVDVEVPDAGCGGQWLQLSLAARFEAEQMAVGRAWYDDLSISRLR